LPRTTDPMSRPAEGAIRAEHVIAEVDAREGTTCGGCTVALIGHDVVLSMLMGQRDAPRCIACLAAGVGDELVPFLRRAHANVRRLDCYGAGWRHADRLLAARSTKWPEERIPASLRLDGDDDEDEACAAPVLAVGAPDSAETFDAGDMGCGDLVLELRGRLGALAPGAVLRVRATDPGAPGDLPAWCRVTRNPLVHSEHPHYWIQRRRDA